MGAIAKAAGEVQKAQGQSFSDYMKQFTPVFKSVMPKGFTPERLTQMAITARNRTPKLAECDMSSFLSCCLQCASLGLEPSAVDGLGRAYIIPRWNGKTRTMEAQFQLGKNGMLELVERTGKVSSIRTQCVYDGDRFEFWEDENGIHFEYRPKLDSIRDKNHLKLVYLSCRLKDGGSVFLYMSKNEIDSIMQRSQSKDRNGNVTGPWVTDYEAMAEKTVIRRAFNRGMLPRSVEINQGIAQDETTPVVLDESGCEVLSAIPQPEGADIPENVDPETGEIKEDNDE